MIKINKKKEKKALTRSYYEIIGIAVTAESKRSHSHVIPRVRFERAVTVSFLRALARCVLADRILDDFYVAIIVNVLR